MPTLQATIMTGQIMMMMMTVVVVMTTMTITMICRGHPHHHHHHESDEDTTTKAVYEIRSDNNKGTVNTCTKLSYIIYIAIKYSFIISFCLTQYISSKS
jgi:flagellar basal body-associated protein FliL